MVSLILIVVVVIFVVKKFIVNFVIPKWIWTALGLFLVVVVIYNPQNVWSFITTEAEKWYPVLESGAQTFMDGIRGFIGQMERK